MKKVISVSLIVALLFAFTACSSKEYKDIPVTDESGQTVTDENGDVVTERIKADKDSEDEQESSDTSTGTTAAQDSDGSGNSSGASNRNVSNANSSGGSNSSGNSSKYDSQADDNGENHYGSPKRRDIDVTVVLPFYNNEETKLTVYYMVDGDKKYTKLETRDIELKDYKFGKEEKFVIENVKGKVTVKVEFEGITITNDTDTEEVAANEDSVKIKPVTGIEIMEGGWD